MIDLGRIFAIAASASFALTNFAKADDQLMQGVKSFVCDGKTIVLLESGTEWVIADEPELEVHRTNSGWRLGDQGIGFISFLQQKKIDDWVLEHLSKDGFEEVECIDVTEATSTVVSAIRPRLNENIIDIQEQLAVAENMLINARKDYEDLQAAFDSLQEEKRDPLEEKLAATEERLARAIVDTIVAEQELESRLSEAEQRSVLLSEARDRLAQSEERASKAAKQAVLLNQQVAQLRTQLSELQALLDDAKARDAASRIEIQNLGSELNAAIARVAQEESRRRIVEEQKRRLEEELARKLGEED